LSNGDRKGWGRFPFWAIEEFWLPSDGVGLANGNQNFFSHRPMMWICRMVIEFFQLPINTPPLSNGDQFFLIAQKGMGEGHEMTIRTRGGGKNGKKAIRTRGKY